MECLRSITPLAHLTLPKTATKPHPGICARSLRGLADSPVVQPRENARIQFGRCGFDAHRARQFRRAVEFGLSVKRETASAFKPRTIGQLMESHLASCPSSWPCASTLGWAAVLRLSNWVA